MNTMMGVRRARCYLALVAFAPIEDFVDTRRKDLSNLHCQFKRRRVARRLKRDDRLPSDANRFRKRLLSHFAMREAKASNLIVDRRG